MVGPVVKIGVPGTSQYRVDWSPVAQGWGDLGRGLGDLGKSIQARRDKEQKTQQQKTLGELMAGDSSNEEIVSQATAAGVPIGTTFKLLHARNALKPKESDSPFANFYNPATDERQAARRGSKEAADLARGGWLSGNPETTTPTQRRIVKGADDLNYYEDTKERVLPGVTATPKRDRAQIGDVMRLADEWQQATLPVRELARQRDLMSIGLKAASEGNMVAGSQAVLVTFQKILDPTSVVRESEYARSSSGLALIERVKGEFTKLREGGAGLTLNQLKSFAQLADDAVAKLSSGRVRDERKRIERFADHYGIDKSIIFSGSLGTEAPAAPSQQPAPIRQGNASDRFAGAPWQQGPRQSAPAQASMMPSPAARPGPAAVRKEQFNSGGMPPGGSEPAPRQYTFTDPGQSRMGAAGLSDLNAPPAPDAQPGDLEQAVEYLTEMSEAEMAGLNLQSMTMTGLKALQIARQRRQQQTMASDYMHHTTKDLYR